MALVANRHIRAVALFVLVTLLKMGLWTALENRGSVHPFVGDNATAHYLPIARRLLTEHRFNGPDSRPDSKVPPAYPLFLAGTMALAPDSFVQWSCLLQMMMDLATALVLYWVAHRLGLRTCGLLAGCVWLLYPPAVVISTWITAETAFTTLFVLGMGLFAISLETKGATLALAGGLVMGAATMLRATPLFLPAVLLPASWRASAIGRWWMFSIAMGMVVAPWLLRNLVVLDDPIPVAVGTGSVMMQGSDERFFTGDGKATYYPETFRAADQAGIHKPATDHESQIDRWMGRVGLWVQLTRLQQRPLSAIPFFAHKLVRLWYGTESGGLRQQVFLGFFALLVAPAGLWQLWLWRASYPNFANVLLSAVAYFILLHTITLPEARYMFPIFPLLILPASSVYERVPRWQIPSAVARSIRHAASRLRSASQNPPIPHS